MLLLLSELIVLLYLDPCFFSLQGKKLFVIGTTSEKDILESMGLLESFNVDLVVPRLRLNDMREVKMVLSQLAVEHMERLTTKSSNIFWSIICTSFPPVAPLLILFRFWIPYCRFCKLKMFSIPKILILLWKHLVQRFVP